jgi:hypothetical protein
MFGTVEAPYWKHNPGSRERLPKRAAGIRPFTPDDEELMIARQTAALALGRQSAITDDK